MPSKFKKKFEKDKRPEIDWELFDSRKEDFSDTVTKYSKEYDVPESLVWAMMYRESNMTNPEGANHAGAVGPMQLTPIIAKEYNVDFDTLKDSGTNIQYGVRYMKDLLKRFDNDVPKAVAAYNAGPTAVRRKGTDWNYETASYAHFVPSYQKAIEERAKADTETIDQYVFGKKPVVPAAPSFMPPAIPTDDRSRYGTAAQSSTFVAPPLMSSKGQ